jgi:hypothetical protein
MGRLSLCFLQILIGAAAALGVAALVPALAWSQNTFGGTGTVFVPYANAATNANLAASPSVNVGFNSSGRYTPFTMDTGVGIAYLTPPVGSSVGPLVAFQAPDFPKSSYTQQPRFEPDESTLGPLPCYPPDRAIRGPDRRKHAPVRRHRDCLVSG